VVVIRPPAVYGPRDRDFLAPFRLIRRGWDLTVGGRDLHLCLIHVRDLVEGIIRGAEAEVASGSAYFLSDGEAHVWSQVVRVLEGIMDVHVKTIRLPVAMAWAAALCAETVCALRGVPPLFNRQKVREMIQEAWTCDIQRASQELGFTPQISLERGLSETYRWYREQGWI
jgi:nucleoside-diphosphate-sugar epimerase